MDASLVVDVLEDVIDKYGNIYKSDYMSVSELKEGVKNYIYKYNFKRFHSALNYKKPMNVYLCGIQKEVKNVA